jgi:predicted metal-dependent phosphoesterase TrpH
MTGVRIDLHVHSNASDGTDAPADVIRRAARGGLDILALTDHDTQAGIAEASAALPVGLTFVPGMELSCALDSHLAAVSGLGTVSGLAAAAEASGGSRYPGQRSVHLLAFLFDPSDLALGQETARIRDDRVYRAKGMVAKLQELGANVTWEQVIRIAGDAVVGRPHIARAMAESGVVATPQDAFTADWIDDGGRAFVDRYAIPLDRAVALIRAAGGVSVLAHPRSPGYEVPDEVIVRLATVGLHGLEVHHPDHPETERLRLTALATDLGLLVTGGSDDHGAFNNAGLGRESTPPESYERILALATGDDPVPAVPLEAVPPQAMPPGELPPDVVPPQLGPEL